MSDRSHLCFLFILFILVSGCAPVISPELRKEADSSLTFSQAIQNPNVYKGKIVIWGGEIIQTLPQEDGTTLIEVLEWPLSRRGEPKRTVSFRGKFLVLIKEYLDPALYRSGKRITVAGEIQGERLELLIEKTSRYPLLLGKEIYLWGDHYYYPYSSPPYRERGPREYDPSERPLRF